MTFFLTSPPERRIVGVLALFECGLAGQLSLLPSGHRYTLPASKSF